MKTYKGFNADMTCRGFQYEPGGEYEMDGEIKACKCGFHACEMPLDVLRYYAPGKNARYFEVEQGGEIARDSDDSKIASSKIRIGAEIGLPGLIKAQVEWVNARTTTEHTDPKATAGDQGVSSAGWHGVSSAGDQGVSSAGWHGVSSAGDKGVSSAGWHGASSAGDQGVSSAGRHGASSAGDQGVSVSRGSASVGKNGIACVRGSGVRVRGGIGALLVIGVEQDNSYDLDEWRAVVVDGEAIKADTWYTLRDGELVEAE